MKSAPVWLVRTACIVGFQIRRDLDPSRQAQVPADLSTRIADALRHLPTEQRVILEREPCRVCAHNLPLGLMSAGVIALGDFSSFSAARNVKERE
jgi:hypothetical protein